MLIIISYMYIHVHDSLQTIAALALPTNVPVLSTLVKKAWNCLGYNNGALLHKKICYRI